MRLHIADVREWTEHSNPWLDREDAFLIAPLMLNASLALVDVLEYMLDTNPPSVAWDMYRRMLHQGESTIPAPLVTWACECSACEPALDGVSSSPAVRHLLARRAERAFQGAASTLGPGDLPTEPLEIAS